MSVILAVWLFFDECVYFVEGRKIRLPLVAEQLANSTADHSRALILVCTEITKTLPRLFPPPLPWGATVRQTLSAGVEILLLSCKVSNSITVKEIKWAFPASTVCVKFNVNTHSRY